MGGVTSVMGGAIENAYNLAVDIVSANPKVPNHTWNRGLTVVLLPLQMLWQAVHGGERQLVQYLFHIFQKIL